MHDNEIKYLLDNFIEQSYVESESDCYLLTEEQESGKTELTVNVSGENLCLKQYDKKNRCGFWKKTKNTGLSKCVDHAILQNTKRGWILHLIEMKGRIDNRKWFDVRLKNRTSYLDVKALACILGIDNFAAVYSYTTYREDHFTQNIDDTNPRERIALLGKRKIDPFREWQMGKMHIQIGLNKELVFYHQGLQMKNKNGILVGNLHI